MAKKKSLDISTTRKEGRAVSIVNSVEPILVGWDHKEQPDWNLISKAINKVQAAFHKVRIIEVKTDNDEFAIAIGDLSLTQEEADFLYHNPTKKFKKQRTVTTTSN